MTPKPGIRLALHSIVVGQDSYNTSLGCVLELFLANFEVAGGLIFGNVRMDPLLKALLEILGMRGFEAIGPVGKLQDMWKMEFGGSIIIHNLRN